MDCVFCKIAEGQIPCKVISETPRTMTLLDAYPLALGHTLVIPKGHYAMLRDVPESENAALFEAVRQASARVDRLSGATLIAVHNGKASGQEIPHVHVHLIPRRDGDGAGAVHSMFPPMERPSDDEMESVCGMLRG